MKTRRIILAVMVTMLFAACGENTKVNVEYDHPERYSVGDAVIAQPVTDISISWINGGVSIQYTDGPDFRIREESDSLLTDSLRMRYRLTDDGELKIQFCQKGSYRAGRLVQINKRLVVEVPHDANLDEIEIDMVDGLITYDSVRCRTLDLDVVNVATTVCTNTLPHEVDVNAVKTTLRFYVPPTAGMTIDMNSVSTELNCDLPVRKEGKKTVIGDGRCEVDLNAVKCSVFINGIPRQ